MHDEVTFSDKAFAILLKKAEPKFVAALSEHGVSSPDQLPDNLVKKICREVLLQTAFENFPEAQLDALSHSLGAFFNPLFLDSMRRVKNAKSGSSDAFRMAIGADAAIVLAGLGLPIAPFDKRRPQILADLTTNLEQTKSNFDRWKTAYVGYSPCDTPFYILLTDCVKTLKTQLKTQSALAEVNDFCNRCEVEMPCGPLPSFRHGMVLLARQPGDTMSTVFLNNPNLDEGSVGFFAGWTEGEERQGAPNNGYVPVPTQFLEAVLADPEIALWIWRPEGARVNLN